MKHFPGKVFNATNCVDNCTKWILKLGEEKDVTINLYHVMDFGKGKTTLFEMVHDYNQYGKNSGTKIRCDRGTLLVTEEPSP